jgi:hypothetical protein
MLPRQRLTESHISLLLFFDASLLFIILKTNHTDQTKQHPPAQPTRTEPTSSKIPTSIVHTLLYNPLTYPPSTLHFIKYKQTYTLISKTPSSFQTHTHTYLPKHSFPSKPPTFHKPTNNGRFKLLRHRRSRPLLHRIPRLPPQDGLCPPGSRSALHVITHSPGSRSAVHVFMHPSGPSGP